MQGLHASELRTKEGTEKTILEFQEAIALDPNYAAAYGALARVYSLASVDGALPAQESMTKAREAAQRAITLDDSLAEGHAVMGFVKAHFDFDWPGAERGYLRGLELNPNDAYAHMFTARRRAVSKIAAASGFGEVSGTAICREDAAFQECKIEELYACNRIISWDARQASHPCAFFRRGIRGRR